MDKVANTCLGEDGKTRREENGIVISRIKRVAVKVTLTCQGLLTNQTSF